MTIAKDILARRMPDLEFYKRSGESLDDIDEYGFTPLIECAITKQIDIAEALLSEGVDVNKPDVTGRTPLHWAVDNEHVEMAHLLLEKGADPNAYTRAGFSVLIYPLLRQNDSLKRLLYSFGAKPDFAQDFIYGKLLGHRYELKGYADIVNARGVFIELDYEGFILEFTVAVIRDSLRRFSSSYSTKHLRMHFSHIHNIMDALTIASDLLKLQLNRKLQEADLHHLEKALKAPLLILPAASQGHAMGFVKSHQWWAKIDRGENSLKEGSINIYRITRPDVFNISFLQEFLYKRQSRHYFHEIINQQLGLMPVATLPISSQITGNCSWANIQATVPVAYLFQNLEKIEDMPSDIALAVYDEWLRWDQDRALDESIQHFYLASSARKASYSAMLGSILFQTCDYQNPKHMERAEKILKVLVIPEYRYVLDSYIKTYCVTRMTKRGNNLLKILDECGVNPELP